MSTTPFFDESVEYQKGVSTSASVEVKVNNGYWQNNGQIKCPNSCLSNQYQVCNDIEYSIRIARLTSFRPHKPIIRFIKLSSRLRAIFGKSPSSIWNFLSRKRKSIFQQARAQPFSRWDRDRNLFNSNWTENYIKNLRMILRRTLNFISYSNSYTTNIKHTIIICCIKWSTENLLVHDSVNRYCSACDTAHNQTIASVNRNNLGRC